MTEKSDEQQKREPGETPEDIWWKVIAGYVVAAPTAGLLFLLFDTVATPEQSSIEMGLFLLAAAGLWVLVPLTPLVLVAIFIDSSTVRYELDGWSPNSWLWVGFPVLGAVAAVFLGGFWAALFPAWFGALLYLVRRFHRLGFPHGVERVSG